MTGTIGQELKTALRMLLKNPGFTFISALALALGIGATSAIFSIVNGVLLRPLPFQDPERIVWIWENNLSRNQAEVEVSYPNFVDWREQNRVFEQLAALPSVNFDVTLKTETEPVQVETTSVSVNFFSLVGAKPVLGRDFLAEEDKPEAPPTIIISDGLWKRHFGANPAVIGKTVVIDDTPATVVGVMPAEFDFPKGVQVWSPLSHYGANWMKIRAFRVMRTIGKLKPGVTTDQAQAEMNSIARTLAQSFPKENTGYGVTMIPLLDSVFGKVGIALKVLLGAVILVLLIACVNVANFQLVRMIHRRKELTLRVLLGASRWRLVRMLMFESLTLALVGGLAGLVIALLGVDILKALAPVDIPRIQTVSVDARVVGFTLLISVLTTLIFGLVPALRVSKTNLEESLRETSAKLAGSSQGTWLRNWFVISEIALALVLMVGAGLMVRTFHQLQHLDPGFNPNQVLTFRLPLSQAKYQTSQDQKQFFEKTLDQVRQLPGVVSAGAVLQRPLSGTVGWDYPFTVEGQSPEEHDQNPYSNYECISPGYFKTMGIPVLAGRDFTDFDRGDQATVVIVGESFAKRYWPGANPVGKRLQFGKPGSKSPMMAVVGVVKDVRYREWDDTRLDIYVPIFQKAEFRADFVLKLSPEVTQAQQADLVKRIQQIVFSIDKDQVISAVTTLNSLVAETLARPKFNAVLLGLLAGFAIVLAVLGIYGVMSYSVTQRTQEIGIRLALGARTSDVIGLVVNHGMRLAVIGITLGLLGSYVLSRFLTSLLFGVKATDPATYILLSLTLLVVARLACYLPARRAARIDPMVALRCE